MVTNEEKITLKDILPEITINGIDYSLLTQREIQHLQFYSKIRDELSEKYPNPHPEYEDDTLNIQEAKKDAKASQFTRSIMTAHTLMEKIDHLKTLATPYEIHCVRLYCKLLMNWMFHVHKIHRKGYKLLIYNMISDFSGGNQIEYEYWLMPALMNLFAFILLLLLSK